MINSGLKLPKPAIPMPAFEVPYAAPTVLKIIEEATPAKPKNGAYGGHVDIM